MALALAFGIHALLPSLPAMTLAVVLGIAAANLPGVSGWVGGSWQPGLRFAGKHLMRAGIVLLGLKLSLGDIAALGWQSFALIVAVVLLSFAGTYALGKLFKLPGDAPLLIATGFSICGASAIGAMAAVRGTKHQDTVLPVALVTLCGTLAIGTLPLLMHPGLGCRDVWPLGWCIGSRCGTGGGCVPDGRCCCTQRRGGHQIVQVVLLAPIVATAGLFERRRRRATAAAADHAGTFPPIVPLFVVGFLAMIAVRSLGWASPAVLDFGNTWRRRSPLEQPSSAWVPRCACASS